MLTSQGEVHAFPRRYVCALGAIMAGLLKLKHGRDETGWVARELVRWLSVQDIQLIADAANIAMLDHDLGLVEGAPEPDQ